MSGSCNKTPPNLRTNSPRPGRRCRFGGRKDNSLHDEGKSIVTFTDRRRIGIAAGLILALVAGTALAATGAQFVQARRGLFGEMSDALKFAADRWRDPAAYGDVAQSALVIRRDALNVVQLFPDGTSANDGFRTAALDSVWSERPGFNRLAKQLAQQAGGLATITSATPTSDVRQQLAAIIATCKACHRDYRAQ
jgi:cytochrome c556